jgi:hypothetical protein
VQLHTLLSMSNSISHFSRIPFRNKDLRWNINWIYCIQKPKKLPSVQVQFDSGCCESCEPFAVTAISSPGTFCSNDVGNEGNWTNDIELLEGSSRRDLLSGWAPANDSIMNLFGLNFRLSSAEFKLDDSMARSRLWRAKSKSSGKCRNKLKLIFLYTYLLRIQKNLPVEYNSVQLNVFQSSNGTIVFFKMLRIMGTRKFTAATHKPGHRHYLHTIIFKM